MDGICRNNGSCTYCMGNRLYRTKKKEEAFRSRECMELDFDVEMNDKQEKQP